MSCNFEILLSFPSNWLYAGLISLYFVQVLYRFNVFIKYLLPGSGWQTMSKTWLTDFRVFFVAQLLPQWFTMFTSFLDVHFISQDWSAIISIVFFFTRQIWQQNYRPATTTTKTKQKQHRVRNHVAKENNITKAITKNNITNIITNNIAKYSKQWQTTNNYKRGTLRITNNKKQQQKQTKECHRDLKAGGALGGRAQRLPPKACSPGCFHHHHHHQQHNNSQQQEEHAKITLSQRKPKTRISI